MEEKLVTEGAGAAGTGRQFEVKISDITKYLKKLFALWIAVSVVISLIIVTVTGIVKYDSYQNLTALISFTYDGVEKGLDPNGNKFYVNSVKSDSVVKAALEKMNLPAEDKDYVEGVQRGITFEGIIPQDAINRITKYTNLFENGSEIATSEQVLETTYYPTQYTVHFDYSKTELSAGEAEEFLNLMLEEYDQYFLDSYGFNKSLENSLNAFTYQDYDYAEVIDVFDSSLTKLSTYISQVSSTDSTRFRSPETGYTFSDLTEAISTIRSHDLDTLESYVTINSVTKEKETLLTYYRYIVEDLQRHLTVCNETLASVNTSISEYKKDTVMVFGETEGQTSDITASVTSKEYDALFEKRQSIQNDLSSTAQKINKYNKRIERLNASTQINSAENKAKVEEEISRLDEQMKDLISKVSATTDDYYRTVVFPKAYNVLTPASSSFLSVPKHAVKDSLGLVVTVDAVIFALYLSYALYQAIRAELAFVKGGESGAAAKKEKKDKKEKKSGEDKKK